jgi:hypothetical protein
MNELSGSIRSEEVHDMAAKKKAIKKAVKKAVKKATKKKKK